MHMGWFGLHRGHARDHWAGRHGHGAGGFGRGFGGGFGGGYGGFGGEHLGGRKFSSAQLQMLLLALLEAQPAHGYELIKALEERSGGFYAPSPGMVYPALTYLDETGLAEATADGNRKRYAITAEGRTHLGAHRAEVEAILAMLARIGGRMQAVREAFDGVDDAEPSGAEDLHRAKHRLKAAVMQARGAGPAELRRIARILDGAARRILSGDAAEGEV